MKRTLINTGIVVVFAILAMIIFNNKTSRKDTPVVYTEVKKGVFEISVSAAGELIAEKSIDIKGPVIGQGRNQQGGQGRGNPVFQGRGSDMHFTALKILDIVPEGTIVKEGDYVAQLDRTTFDNTLKDELQNLTTLNANVEMKILDTAVVLTNLRDEIKNQRFAVEEAQLTLEQSKYEPPATIRQAEIYLDKAKRNLEQKERSYTLRVAQTLSEINHEKFHLTRGTRLVTDLQEYLSGFTVKAPSSGMVIYKKERNGTKRKAGSLLNPFDMIVATLPDLSSMISKTYVNEIEVSKVKSGQNVNILVDAFPDKAYIGKVISIANIGEQLPNSDAKMFETLIKIDGSDPALRPTMTTGNKIIIQSISDAVYIPIESVQTGSDSIPFVFEKNKTKQIVVLGEANEKNVIIKQGLEPGTLIYLVQPENPETFKLVGQNFIPMIRESDKTKQQ
jgi:multidrug efflux pump subunit AcrA (membrane-fusion protein)